MISFRLVLQYGVDAGTEFPLEKTEIFIGRDVANDIVINDPEVSRRHAHLSLKGNTFSIEDLGSTNGTFLRGQRLSAPVLLNPGEVITLGEHVTLLFDVVVMDVNATVAAFREPETVRAQPPAGIPESHTPAVPQEVVQPSDNYSYPHPAFQIPIVSKPPDVPAPVYQPVAPPVVKAQAPQDPIFSLADDIEAETEPPMRKKRSPWLVALLVVVLPSSSSAPPP